MPSEGKKKFKEIDFGLRKDRNDCIILGSKEIKNTLIQKCKDLGITLNEVIVHHGDDMEAFNSRYVNRRSPRSGPKLSQAQLLKYLKFVGIKFNMIVVKGLEADKERIEDNVRLIKDNRRDRALRKKKQ